MKKVYGSIILLIIMGLFITGCTTKEDIVKEGKFAENKSMTIGKALENYKYFKSIKWHKKESNGKETVVAECQIDLDKDPQMDAFKKISKNAVAIFEFESNNNGNISALSLVGKTTTINGEIKSKVMPKSPVWLEPKQIFIDRIYDNKYFTDITAQIINQ